jgi:AP2 domain-containing protein/HNH endonuclease
MKEISLPQGKVALVDDEDYERLARMCWAAKRRPNRNVWYAQCDGGPLKGRRMHRILLNFPPYDIDHKDGDGLNNQKSNLRPATNQQNQRNARLRKDNTTGFKGVKRRAKGRWGAVIRHNGRDLSLGSFATIEEAARAYDRKALEFGGEFARLNFPKEQYEQA